MRLMDMHVLTAINHTNRKFYTIKTYSQYSVAGIALIELLRMGKIRLEGEKVSVADTTSSGDKLLDDVLFIISKAPSSKKLTHWIRTLQSKMRKMMTQVLENLEDNGIIRIDQVNFLGIFPVKRYIITHENEKAELTERLKRALKEEPRNISEDDAILTSLAHTCGFLKKYLPREEQTIRKARLKAIRKCTFFQFKEEYTLKVVKAVQKAISEANSATYAGAGI